jgi:hypothetical protein
MYYADQIKRNFPLALNTGPDVGAFTRGLASGKRGSYFGVSPEEYEKTLSSFQSAIPENRMLPFEPTAQPEAGSAPAEPPAETDEQRDARIQKAMDEQEKRQAQLMGGATGVGVSGTKLAGAGVGAALEAGATRVGQGFRAGMQGRSPLTTTPVQGGLSVLDPNANQATRILQGTTGDEGTTGRARMGFNEETARQAAQRKEADRILSRLKQAGVIASDAPAVITTAPGMTSSPSGVQYPRSAAPQTLGPRGPEGQIGFTRPPPPAPPSMFSRAVSGLDSVTDMFKSMIAPAVKTATAVSKYVVPPLALASAAGEGVNIAQQSRKPEEQRDKTGMALSGANILGSGLSLFPATAPVGIPMMLGTGAAQMYRDSPEAQAYVKRKIKGIADTPLLDEMTGPLP